jgi:uncharacterized membrane protein HdeD (DUF308 family)
MGASTEEKAMSLNQPDIGAAFRRSLHDHWRAFLVEGIILVILGVAAIALPPIAGLAVTVVLGWLFLFGGVVGLIATFNQKNAPGFWWALFSAAIAVLAGGVLLADPAHGLATLTYVLIAFFLIDGIIIIVMAFEHRRELSGRWEWMMLGGVMDLVLAAIIISGLPGTLAWALGLLVGIDLLWGGMSLIAMALHARNVSP